MSRHQVVHRLLWALTGSCLVAMGVLYFSGMANAQQCGPRDGIVGQLAQRFQEVPAGRGAIGEQALMELFLSPSGSWTILGTDSQKRSCVVMGGDAFEFVAPEPVKPGRGT